MLAQERVGASLKGCRPSLDLACTETVSSPACIPVPPTPLPPCAPQDVMTDRDVCSGNRGVCAGTIDHPALGATQLC